MEISELEVGKYYDIEAGSTTYKNVRIKTITEDGIGIWWMGMAFVFIATHEFEGATLAVTQPS